MNLHKHVHFIGIGGISMSALAMITLSKGIKVSGSDRQSSPLTDKLKDMGIEIFIGHSAENIANPDLVVFTGAISHDNIELATAHRKEIKCIERSEYLGLLTKNYSCPIAVAGTHGKTTTTSMLSCIFMEAEKDPTILVGGELNNIGGNLNIGAEDYLIFEACEYRDSFLQFFPSVAIILNLEEDHLDYFSGIEQIQESFTKFLNKLPDDGFAVLQNDDKNLMQAAEKSNCKKITFGLNKADFTAESITWDENGYPSFDVIYEGKTLSRINLNAHGLHNVSNAVGSFALAYTLGLTPETIKRGLEKFCGTGRRFEYKGQFDGVRVYDDYAHHPTEIASTIKAAKQLPHNKLWVVFQPHTYTRTKAFKDQFAEALNLADEVVVSSIYAAREPFDDTISGECIVKLLKKGVYIPSFVEIAQYIRQNAQNNDVVFVMGAGDIIQVSQKLVQD